MINNNEKERVLADIKLEDVTKRYAESIASLESPDTQFIRDAKDLPIRTRQDTLKRTPTKTSDITKEEGAKGSSIHNEPPEAKGLFAIKAFLSGRASENIGNGSELLNKTAKAPEKLKKDLSYNTIENLAQTYNTIDKDCNDIHLSMNEYFPG